MEKAAIIFNGIYFSFPVIEKAFAWAKTTNGNLLAVFLSSKKETGEGYIYPSDLDEAEDITSDKEAENEDDKILQSNIRMMQHRATGDQVKIEIKVLYKPSESGLSGILQGCTQIFVADNIEEPGIVTVESINLTKFFGTLNIPVTIVSS